MTVTKMIIVYSMAAIALATTLCICYLLLLKPLTPSEKQAILRSFLVLTSEDLSPILMDITSRPATARGVIGIDDEGTWFISRLDPFTTRSGRSPSPNKDHLTQLQEVRSLLRGIAGEVLYIADYPNLRFTIIDEKAAFLQMQRERPRKNEYACLVESQSRP